MKRVLLVVFCIAFAKPELVRAQTIDWENAPINPVALPYLKEHFNVHGAVYLADKHAFDTQGRCITEGGFLATSYRYPDENTLESRDYRYYINDKGLIEYGIFIPQGVESRSYSYNPNDQLIQSFDGSQGKHDYTYYTYDNSDRVIISKKVVDGTTIAHSTYSYEQTKDGLRITSKDVLKDTIKDISIWKNGRKIAKKKSYGNELETITNRLDRKGNLVSFSIGDAIYDKQIIYRKELKNNNITIKRIKDTKGMFTEMYEVYRNGTLAPDLKIESGGNHVVLFDPFDRSYYVLQDGYKRQASNYKLYDVSQIPKNKQMPVTLLSRGHDAIFIKTSLGWRFYDQGNYDFKLSTAAAGDRIVLFDTGVGSHGRTYISDKLMTENGIEYSNPIAKESDMHAFLINDKSGMSYIVVKGKIQNKASIKLGEIKGGERLVYVNNQPSFILPSKKDIQPDTVLDVRSYFGEEILK